jgi:hypothetical protein
LLSSAIAQAQSGRGGFGGLQGDLVPIRRESQCRWFGVRLRRLRVGLRQPRHDAQVRRQRDRFIRKGSAAWKEGDLRRVVDLADVLATEVLTFRNEPR